MQKLRKWIKNHQVTAFFLITFAITWGLGFAYNAVLNQDQFLWLPLAFLSICGPGLTGIIISTATNTQPKQGSRKGFGVAFLVAWSMVTSVYLTNWHFIESATLSPLLVGLFTIAVVPVAFVIASAYSRIPDVRSYLSSLVLLRGVWGWSLLALVLFPALFLIAYPLNSLINGQPIPTDQLPEISLSLVGLVVVKFLYQFFFFNATGEETGWRGFVLLRLQVSTSPLIAALVIGVFWASWHFFFWRADGRPVGTLDFWLDMYVGHVLLSILIVWICNRAKGSILVAGVAHAATNTVQAFVPVWGPLLLVLSVTTLVVVLVDRMWKKLPQSHAAVYKPAGLDEKMFELTQQVAEKSAA